MDSGEVTPPRLAKGRLSLVECFDGVQREPFTTGELDEPPERCPSEIRFLTLD